jgi:hypothetical protein
MPENTVSVCRPGRWGNPYSAEIYGLKRCLALFEETLRGGWNPRLVDGLDDELARSAYMRHQQWMQAWAKRGGARREELRGKNLACFCPLAQPCHADILLSWANAYSPETRQDNTSPP